MIVALLDGRPADSVPLTDSSVLRGDGCFEAIRSYAGRAYAIGWHLDRLERSARALGISAPRRSDLEEWCAKMAAQGDGVVRVVLSRGGAVPGDEAPARCVVMFHELPNRKCDISLAPVSAPWHPAGEWYELAGAKTLSYAPNLAAQRTAQERGFDDALLLATDGTVLECPTASVAWVVDGVIETPTLALHILDSITRRTMLLLAEGRWDVLEDRFVQSRLASATEVMVMSTVREITPVTRVGEMSFEPGPVTAELAESFMAVVGTDRGS